MDEIVKNVVQLCFFLIRSLEITNILECSFSPFSSLFDLLSRRNNIFFTGAVSASMLAHL